MSENYFVRNFIEGKLEPKEEKGESKPEEKWAGGRTAKINNV